MEVSSIPDQREEVRRTDEVVVEKGKDPSGRSRQFHIVEYTNGRGEKFYVMTAIIEGVELKKPWIGEIGKLLGLLKNQAEEFAKLSPERQKEEREVEKREKRKPGFCINSSFCNSF